MFVAGTGRRGTPLRGCPPPCGLLLDAAAQSAPSTCARCGLAGSALPGEV